MSVTRVEVVSLVQGAFQDGTADRDEILDEARRRDASEAVVETLQRLPAGRYQTVRDIWSVLPDIPIGT